MSTIHGIVGLTPFSAGSVLDNSPPFMMMVTESLLDRNIFLLRLREQRELRFGASDNDLFTGDSVQVPLSNNTCRHTLIGGWQAEAHYKEAFGNDDAVERSGILRSRSQ